MSSPSPARTCRSIDWAGNLSDFSIASLADDTPRDVSCSPPHQELHVHDVPVLEGCATPLVACGGMCLSPEVSCESEPQQSFPTVLDPSTPSSESHSHAASVLDGCATPAAASCGMSVSAEVCCISGARSLEPPLSPPPSPPLVHVPPAINNTLRDAGTAGRTMQRRQSCALCVWLAGMRTAWQCPISLAFLKISQSMRAKST
jgi:hypothetical protein